MSTKRILIVHEDRIITNLYREKLEGSGFAVDTARGPDQAFKLIENKKPDLIITDLVLQNGGGLPFIKSLRCEPATMELPVLVFPTNLSQLATAALQAGATKIIARGQKPVASVIDTVKVTLGLPGLGDSLDAPLFQPDESWLSMVALSAPDSLNQMRHCLPALVTVSPDSNTLAGLWVLLHGFTERAALLPQKALAQTAGSLDLLLCDINEMPEQLTPSTLRTIGQAIDFLGQLSVPENLARTREPGAARVLVIDDEESARQFISAAMQLAGLKTEIAETPARAIEKLTATPCDLIFLDVGLPEMNGFDLCARIRGIEEHQKTPIIFLTGMNTFQNKAQASLSGGNDFVGKPFNLPELCVKALIWLFRGQLGLV